MSRRNEILLIVLFALALAAWSMVVARAETAGEGPGWTVLAIVASWLALGMTALAWAGWGRWMLDKTGVSEPSRRWWLLWFVPWAFWAVVSLARGVVDARDEAFDVLPNGLALLTLAIGLLTALTVFVLVLVFAFREIGYLRRRSRSGSDVPG